MAFQIHFAGLIAHVQDDGSWRAVVLNAHDHRCHLIVPEGSLIEAEWPDADSSDGHLRFHLDRTLMSNLPGGMPTPSAKYKKHVPSLQKALSGDGTIDHDAKKGRRHHPGVRTALTLGAGTIDVLDCFPKKVRWRERLDDGDHEHGRSEHRNEHLYPHSAGAAAASDVDLPTCLACAVTYTATFPGKAFPIRVSDAENVNQYILLKSTAAVWIVNSTNRTDHHFHSYALLAREKHVKLIPELDPDAITECGNGCKIPTAVLRDERDDDDRVTIRIPTFDCSNSNYP